MQKFSKFSIIKKFEKRPISTQFFSLYSNSVLIFGALTLHCQDTLKNSDKREEGGSIGSKIECQSHLTNDLNSFRKFAYFSPGLSPEALRKIFHRKKYQMLWYGEIFKILENQKVEITYFYSIFLAEFKFVVQI